MSDTPRTDEFSRRFGPNMTIDLCRQLERELSILQAKRIACPYCNPIQQPQTSDIEGCGK